MTAFQVFLAYCKLRGIMPKIYRISQKNVEEYKYSQESKDWIIQKVTPEQFFNSYYSSNGFYNIFDAFITKFGNYHHVNIPEDLRLPSRRWDAFRTDNIILENPIKKSDRIKFISTGFNAFEKEGVCTADSSRCDGRFLVTVDGVEPGGRREWVSLGNVIEKNGEKYEPSFIIKWKRKVYGAKKSE